MKPLEQWIAEVKAEEKKQQSLARDKLDHEYFFRDPGRPLYIDDDFFFSPADGIVLYQTVVKKGTDKVLEVKGSDFTLQELMGDPDFNQACLVIGIFMTSFDVHINRMPSAGVLNYRLLDPISTKNVPMLATEKGILKDFLSPNVTEYMRQNGRMINHIFCPFYNYNYYVVQVSDEDVDLIMPFSVVQHKWYHQCSRFSLVRWGSQVDLILPLDNKLDFILKQPTMCHVEAGQDPLVEVRESRRMV